MRPPHATTRPARQTRRKKRTGGRWQLERRGGFLRRRDTPLGRRQKKRKRWRTVRSTPAFKIRRPSWRHGPSCPRRPALNSGARSQHRRGDPVCPQGGETNRHPTGLPADVSAAPIGPHLLSPPTSVGNAQRRPISMRVRARRESKRVGLPIWPPRRPPRTLSMRHAMSGGVTRTNLRKPGAEYAS